MPILGPNCYGLINYLDGALMWPDQHGGERVERGVALFQSEQQYWIELDHAVARVADRLPAWRWAIRPRPGLPMP